MKNPFESPLIIAIAPLPLTNAKFQAVQMLRVHGQLSRTHIAELIGYSPSKITGIVNELTDAGIVEEREDSSYTGGRRAKDIFFNPNFGYIVAVVIGMNTLDVALIDFAEKTRVRRLIPIHVKDEPDAVLHSLARFVIERLKKFDIPIEKIYGVGITLSSAIHPASGVPYNSSDLPSWGGFQIESLLREVFPYAVVVIERDTNAMAFGELRKGAAKHLTNIVYINIGRSFDASLIIDGKIYRGANGRTGEIYRIHTEQNTSSDAEKSLKADEAEQESITKHAGKAIATLVNIVDPQMILLGGDESLGHAFLADVRRSILGLSQSSSTQHLQVDLAPLGIEASLVGIMALTAENIFTISD